MKFASEIHIVFECMEGHVHVDAGVPHASKKLVLEKTSNQNFGYNRIFPFNMPFNLFPFCDPSNALLASF